jgi:glycosyltransferase involved in cell wall biosynthesis
VFSEYTAEQLRKYYPKIASNISIQFPRIEEIFHPIDDDAKDAVRYRETNGDAYFLYRGPIHPAAELKNVLKGFSIFKKKMGSNMKLVLCGNVSAKSETFLADLESYKYREDVIIKSQFTLAEETELIAAAYAMVHPCRWERFGFSPLKAMKSGVAVLTVENSSMSEFTSMAGMYFNEKDPNDIGEKMFMIYKDEQMRLDMIGTGLSKGL